MAPTGFNVDLATMPTPNEERIRESQRGRSDAEALRQLEALFTAGGMLEIITNECAVPGCHVELVNGRAVTVHNEDPAEGGIPVTDHRHFVKHAVVAIDQVPDGEFAARCIRAHTAEGDWKVAPDGPRVLLEALTETTLGPG